MNPAEGHRKLVALEGIRGFAALYVLFYHAALLHGRFALIEAFGQEAVIAFFVLSGFVIHLSALRKRQSLAEFMAARIVRIYPVLLVALLVAYACACLAHGRLVDVHPAVLLGNLLMLQDVPALKPGVAVPVYWGNGPLWSLSYEWWFYVGYALLVFSQLKRLDARRVAILASLAGAISYQFIPNQASLFIGYFYIWFCGFQLAEAWYRGREFTLRFIARLLWPLVAIGLVWSCSLGIALANGSHLRPGVWPVLPARHYFDAIVLILAAWSVRRWSFARRLVTPFALIAPVSFSLYAFHYPILDLAKAVSRSPWRAALFALAASLVLGVVVEIWCRPLWRRMRDRLGHWLQRRWPPTPSVVGAQHG